MSDARHQTRLAFHIFLVAVLTLGVSSALGSSDQAQAQSVQAASPD